MKTIQEMEMKDSTPEFNDKCKAVINPEGIYVKTDCGNVPLREWIVDIVYSEFLKDVELSIEEYKVLKVQKEGAE